MNFHSVHANKTIPDKARKRAQKQTAARTRSFCIKLRMNPVSLLFVTSVESSLPKILVTNMDFPYIIVSRIKCEKTWKRAPSSSCPYWALTISKDLYKERIRGRHYTHSEGQLRVSNIPDQKVQLIFALIIFWNKKNWKQWHELQDTLGCIFWSSFAEVQNHKVEENSWNYLLPWRYSFLSKSIRFYT